MENYLVESLKEELTIEEDYEDKYLNRIINIGEKRLEGLVGVPLSFEEGSSEFDLLMTFGRYYYNNSEEYFEEMNSKEILRLQLSLAVMSKGQSDNDER